MASLRGEPADLVSDLLGAHGRGLQRCGALNQRGGGRGGGTGAGQPSAAKVTRSTASAPTASEIRTRSPQSGPSSGALEAAGERLAHVGRVARVVLERLEVVAHGGHAAEASEAP